MGSQGDIYFLVSVSDPHVTPNVGGGWSFVPPLVFMRFDAAGIAQLQLLFMCCSTNYIPLSVNPWAPPPPPPPPAPSVGVIPSANGCPDTASTVRIHMDNEDSRQASYVSGWVGGTNVDGNGNTNFVFCRVSGAGFHSLASFSTGRANYAVLKLDSSCPSGSVEFSRYFDNEDNSNENSVSGPFSPNTVSSQGTELRFCLFKGDGTTGTYLPGLGFSYGVFAGSDFGFTSSIGYIYTDDEDNRNANRYSADSSWQWAALQLISEGSNTTLRTARVQNPVCSDGVCNGMENEVSCPSDCDVCGNGSCSATENLSSCPVDCGWCGDGVCAGAEDAFSCSADCGFCGDGVCAADENELSCEADCSGWCGDDICSANENRFNCIVDCW